MLDVYSDLALLSMAFGCHFELLEMDTLQRIHFDVRNDAYVEKKAEFYANFAVSSRSSEDEIKRAAITAVALDTLVKKYRLGALAYYYEGAPRSEHENIITSVIAGNTLLTSNGTPVAGECEVKNALAMKVMALFGAGGSFSELYAMDFNDDVVLWGHDGPAHRAIAEGKVGLVPLPVYHGKPGKGLSIQMSVKNGPVTFLSVCEGAGGEVFLLCAEGESVPGPTLEIGNTNSRYKFPLPARDFVTLWSKQGPSHHCAIGTGHIADSIGKLAFALGLRCTRIC
jgi:L-arabinose isomerase